MSIFLFQQSQNNEKSLEEIEQENAHVNASVRQISAEMKKNNLNEVFLVSGTKPDFVQSNDMLIDGLKRENPQCQINYAIDRALDNKNKNNKAKKLLHPSILFNRLFSELGLKKFTEKGRKNSQVLDLENLIKEVIEFENSSLNRDAIVIEVTPEIINLFQTNKKLNKYLYFGDEILLKNGKTTNSQKKLTDGELMSVEMSYPLEVGYECKIMTIAQILADREEEKQMD